MTAGKKQLHKQFWVNVLLINKLQLLIELPRHVNKNKKKFKKF